MTDNQQASYPMIPSSTWWKLRELLRKRWPQRIDETYLSQSMNMKAASARANVLPALRLMGLIDKDGKPTELANRWREDSGYSAVCSEILESTYPAPLFDSLGGDEIDKNELKSWFRQNAQVADAAAGKMAATFALLLDADPGKKPDPTASNSRKRSEKSEAKKANPTDNKNDAREPVKDNPVGRMASLGIAPSLHVDVQVHIASDATIDQIDAIFASMAKHLYKDQSS